MISILGDEEKRALYDQTGCMDDAVDILSSFHVYSIIFMSLRLINYLILDICFCKTVLCMSTELIIKKNIHLYLFQEPESNVFSSKMLQDVALVRVFAKYV